MRTVYDFSVKDRKGGDVSLKEYANEVLLIVNTKSLRSFMKPIMHRALKCLISLAINSDSRLLALMRAYISSVN